MVILKFSLEVSINQDLKRERAVITFKKKKKKKKTYQKGEFLFFILSKVFLSIIVQKSTARVRHYLK